MTVLPQDHIPHALIWRSDKPFVRLIPHPEGLPSRPFLSQEPVNIESHIDLPLESIELQGDTDFAWPSGFIFHMSRCGSTLLSQQLMSGQSRLVLAEPNALKELLRPPFVIAKERQMYWLRKLFAIYAHGFACDNKPIPIIVKWTSWNVLALDLITEAFPTVPFCFVCRNPVEVLVSLLTKPSGWMLRRENDPACADAVGLSKEEAASLSDIEWCARCLSQFCAAAARHERTELVEYTDLPEAAWSHVASVFGLRIPPSEISEMQVIARIDAKDKCRRRLFEGDSHQKRQRANAEIELECEQHVVPVLKSLRRRAADMERPVFATALLQNIVDLYSGGKYFPAARIATLNQERFLERAENAGKQKFYRLLGKLLLRLEHFNEAKKQLELLLALSQRQTTNADATADASLLLGRVHRALGNTSQAICLVKRAADIRLRMLGPASPSFATCLDALASLKRDEGDMIRAEQLYRQAASGHAASGQTDLYASLNNLGTLYAKSGRVEEAKRVFADVTRARQSLCGERHYLVASALNNSAELHFQVGERNQAKAAFENAVSMLKEAFPSGHPRTARTLLNYANWLIDADDQNSVKDMLDDGEEIVLACLGERHSSFRRCVDLRSKLKATG